MINPLEQHAISLARFNLLPSMVTDGRYSKTPYAECLCPSNQGCIETIPHIMLHYPQHFNGFKLGPLAHKVYSMLYH